MKENNYATSLTKALELAKTMTPVQIAMDTKRPTLQTVVRKQGIDVATGVLMKIINDCSESFNVGKNMNVKQIHEAAELILNEFKDLKITDIQLAFNRAKSGYYKTSFDRIDVQVLMQWISDYDLDRVSDIVKYNEDKNNQNKIKVLEWSEEVTEAIKPLLKPKVEIKTPDRTTTLFEEYYRRFDALHEKFGIRQGGIRFVKRYGKILDIQEFIEYKIKQLTKINNNLKPN